jgi:hypothetical protein
MTDNRCPVCDKVLQGKQEVTKDKPRIPLTQCPHCKVQLELTSKTDELGVCWFYVDVPKGTL